MKAERVKHTTVELSLDEEEARWLKGLVQNKLKDTEPEAEEIIRESFWQALNEAGVTL